MIDQEQDSTVWIFYTGVVFTFYIAGTSTIDAFVLFYVSCSYLLGHLNPAAYPEWHTTFQKIDLSPASFLLLNLYNIIIWSIALVCSILLISFKTWCLNALRFLLGFDMFFTVFNLIYETLTGTVQISDKGWFITLNIIQVIVILIFSHPKITAWVKTASESKDSPI